MIDYASEHHTPKKPPGRMLEQFLSLKLILPDEGLVVTKYNRTLVGYIGEDGYCYVSLGYKKRLVKRSHLIWFGAHGRWPTMSIDHWDRDKLNDKISNLREALPYEQSRNTDRYVSAHLTDPKIPVDDQNVFVERPSCSII